MARSMRSGPVQSSATTVDPSTIIFRSWQRCREQYRIDHRADTEFAVVEQPRLNECMDRYGEFIHLARTEMENLYQQIAGSGYALLLTDPDGLILDYVGDTSLRRLFRNAGLIRGAIWSEQNEGTNGVGTCIAEMRPVTVHRDQHFRDRHHSLSCSGAPILDADGRLLAVLDASSANAKDTPGSQLHTLALVTMSAQLISKCRFIRNFPDCLILRFHSRPEYVGLINDGALAINGEGVIHAADQNAVAYLGLSTRAELVGRPIDEILDVTPDALHSWANRQSMPYWPTRGLAHGTRYYATVVPGHTEGLPGDRVFSDQPGKQQLRLPKRSLPTLDQVGAGDATMQRNADRARRVAARGIPVLLTGETGTGKEVFARALHESSPWSDGPFVAVNCAAIPENLIESELFGYRPGAFTGAQKNGMKGKVLQANGGTLFLDEIGDMPLELQTRLLRVLEEQEVVPLGGDRPIKVEINLVSATHCDLQEQVAEGRFREDLYYRLNGLQIMLPALRERQDKAALIRSIIREEGGAGTAITDEAFQRLLDHDWPGNIRQLRNVLRTAVALAEDNLIQLCDLGPELEQSLSATPVGDRLTLPDASTLAMAERDALLETLDAHDWNISRTANSLDISRNTLYRKMRKHGIRA
ncbi:MAG: sigma-54-dependent Fis family transcriptional regulator [Rhodobacteraceae bacterium]|nr:sigma-54-dependent Fis family transcriptional regulator [Paracoccaceae bacterium]